MKKDDVIMSAVFGTIGAVLAIISFVVKSDVLKIVFGILAGLVILFTIYGTIDAILKNRRKDKDLEFLMKAMKSEMAKPDFTQRMNAAANKRDILYAGQRPESPDFGYSMENPVMTSTISRSDDYLGRLRTLNGNRLTWKRMGSYCMRELHGVQNVMVDGYQMYENGVEHSVIYLCPYGHSSSHVPQGFQLVKE